MCCGIRLGTGCGLSASPMASEPTSANPARTPWPQPTINVPALGSPAILGTTRQWDMADPQDGVSDGCTSALSPWSREPDMVSLEITSWEHAARIPGSWGKADRVADLQLLLPHEVTEPIYTIMARAEALFLRRTEPLPPFRERLARDFLEGRRTFEPGTDTSTGATGELVLETELNELLPGTQKLGDVVPHWDRKVAAALGADMVAITRGIRNFASLGLPREDYSFSYGYRLHVRRLSGTLLGSFSTHGALLMGCAGPVFQPGPLREVYDALLR